MKYTSDSLATELHKNRVYESMGIDEEKGITGDALIADAISCISGEDYEAVYKKVKAGKYTKSQIKKALNWYYDHENIREGAKSSNKSADDCKYKIYTDYGDGKDLELAAWYDDIKQAKKEEKFLKSKGYKVEIRENSKDCSKSSDKEEKVDEAIDIRGMDFLKSEIEGGIRDYNDMCDGLLKVLGTKIEKVESDLKNIKFTLNSFNVSMKSNSDYLSKSLQKIDKFK